MKIFEEYISRHNLNFPIIHHCNRGVVVLENDLIINIFWQNQKNTIGFYRFNECLIRHNYIRPFKFHKIYWDDYEDFIKIWVKNNNVKALKNNFEVFNFFSKIFLKSNQIKIKNPTRYNIDYQIKKMKNKFLLVSWKNYKNYIDSYSYWFAKIINNSLAKIIDF